VFLPFFVYAYFIYSAVSNLQCTVEDTRDCKRSGRT